MALNTINFPTSGGTHNFYYRVTGNGCNNTSVTFSSDSSWLTVNKNGNGNTVVVSAQTNPNATDRTGHITTKYGTTSCTSNKITVSQAKNEVAPTIEGYLALVTLEDNTVFNFSNADSLLMSTNGGSSWFEPTYIGVADTNTLYSAGTFSSGTEILLKRTASSAGVPRITCTKAFNAKGNVLSLFYGDFFEGETSLPEHGNLREMFKGSDIEDASGLIMPTGLVDYACYSMFENCIYLTTAPSLPATNIPAHAYRSMFKKCMALVVAPVLSATTLATYCYYEMFADCYSLTGTTTLPADYIPDHAYCGMFSGCTSLEVAPQIMGTDILEGCYEGMFKGCESLTAVTALPATVLANGCYQFMFAGCTSLTTAPALPAQAAASNCYVAMFADCSSLTTVPSLPATTLADGCYGYMFSGCTKLTTTTELSATEMKKDCYTHMFEGCTGLTSYVALPTQNVALAENCYGSMFKGCTNLEETQSGLGARELSKSCYRNMFNGCTKIKKAPTLPATTLVERCYESMFSGCTSLSSITAGFLTTPDDAYTKDWVTNVYSGRGNFKMNINATWDADDYRGNNGIPTNWTAEKSFQP